MSLDELTTIARTRDERSFCRAFPAPALVIYVAANGEQGATFRTFGAERRAGMTLIAATAHAARTSRDAVRDASVSVSVAFVTKSNRNPFLGMITLGRAVNNDVILNHGTVSKVHAHLMGVGSTWVVDDDRSSNGTFVGHQAVEPGRPVALTDGSLLRFGPNVSATFQSPESLYRLLASGPAAPVTTEAPREGLALGSLLRQA